MNSDDFEKHLECQSLRPVPDAWREEILSAARARIPARGAGAGADWLAGWRALRARIPLAWGAVACFWLVIIGANMLMSGSSITVASGPAAPIQHEEMTVWNLQRAEFGLLANQLTDVPDMPPARKPAVTPVHPRSERQGDNGIGGLDDGRWFTTTIV